MEETIKKAYIAERLNVIQTELKAPKNLYNSFGKYSYRNAESILEAVKPLLKKYGCTLVLEDEIVNIGERYYVKATATLGCVESHTIVQASAYAREDETKRGMDGSQITGAASSYARKYALNGLFILDDTKDPDTDEYTQITKEAPKTSKERAAADYPPRDEMMNAILEKWSAEKITSSYKLQSVDELTDAQVMTMYNKAVGNSGR